MRKPLIFGLVFLFCLNFVYANITTCTLNDGSSAFGATGGIFYKQAQSFYEPTYGYYINKLLANINTGAGTISGLSVTVCGGNATLPDCSTIYANGTNATFSTFANVSISLNTDVDIRTLKWFIFSTISGAETGENYKRSYYHSSCGYVNGSGGFYADAVFTAQEAIDRLVTLIDSTPFPLASFFELTAKNVYNSTAITNFTANITNITGTYELTTTNGTIYFTIGGLLDIEIFNAPNYFNASFSNINSSANYQASLIPSIFPIYARTNVSNTTLTNFTATIFNSSFSRTETTTSGILYLPYDIGQTYFINVSAPLYATTNTTISNINATFNYIYYLQNNNSIFIQIYDAKTNKLLNFSAEAISIFFTGNITGTYFEESTLNGTFQKDYLPSDYYTIILFNSNYYEQSYFVTLNNNEHKILNAYLLNSTYVSITTTKIINTFGENIENALITLQENIGGSYVTIAQKYTDTTGNALFYLKIGTQYRAIVDKTGYVSQTATITPTQNPYSVTILLQDIEIQTSVNYFECLSIYQKTPSYIYGNMTDFGLWVHSPTSELSYFGIYFNSTNLTNSSVITGGTLTLSVNMSDYSQAIIGFFFKCSGQPEYWENVTYYINTPIENVSIEAGIDLINDKIESEVGVAKQDILRIFIIIGLILILILIAWDVGVPAIAYGFIAEGIIIIFTFIGWIPVLIAILLGVVFIGGSILSIIGEGQNYG